jgi:16S rRNA (adenine(1408)-N(1))-methyltransferase
MREASYRATRKPARGGAANAWFLVHALEALPGALLGVAHEVTVNFPWGTLLQAVTVPRAEGLAAIAALLRPDGELAVSLNRSAQLDPAYAERLGVPVLDDAHVEGALLPGFAAAGFVPVEEAASSGDPRTTWGRRLVEGSGREVLALRFARRT